MIIDEKIKFLISIFVLLLFCLYSNKNLLMDREKSAYLFYFLSNETIFYLFYFLSNKKI